MENTPNIKENTGIYSMNKMLTPPGNVSIAVIWVLILQATFPATVVNILSVRILLPAS